MKLRLALAGLLALLLGIASGSSITQASPALQSEPRRGAAGHAPTARNFAMAPVVVASRLRNFINA